MLTVISEVTVSESLFQTADAAFCVSRVVTGYWWRALQRCPAYLKVVQMRSHLLIVWDCWLTTCIAQLVDGQHCHWHKVAQVHSAWPRLSIVTGVDCLWAMSICPSISLWMSTWDSIFNRCVTNATWIDVAVIYLRVFIVILSDACLIWQPVVMIALLNVSR